MIRSLSFLLQSRKLLSLGDNGNEQEQRRNDQETQRDRPGDEDGEVAPRHDQGSTKGCLEPLPQYQGEYQGSSLIPELLHQKSQQSKEEHGNDIGHVVFTAIGPDQTEQQDHRIEKVIRNLQNLYPQGDQGKVENKKHPVPDIHAHNRSPKKIRCFGNQQRPWLKSVDHQGSQENGHHPIRRNSEGQKGDEGRTGSSVVRRLGSRNTCNRTLS